MHFIELNDVVKEYRMGENIIRANNGINFYIDEGEFCVIVGPSGAGKSTVLNILGGIDQNDEGTVYVDGDNLSVMDDYELTNYRRYQIGFVFQSYNLISNLTAKENVEMATQLVEDYEDAETILTQVGLGHRLDNFPSQLSGGEQQRVAIARALAKKPKILLCDEPTGALDYQTGKQILKLLQNTAKNRGTTVIVVTHNSAIRPIADRVIEISDAKVRRMYMNEDPMSIDDVEW